MPRKRRSSFGTSRTRATKAARYDAAVASGKSAARQRSPVASQPPEKRPRRCAAAVAQAKTAELLEEEDAVDLAALRAALGPKARRLAVASVFVDVLGAPPKEEWRQDFGTVWQIAKLLRRPKGSYGSILRVLRELQRCALAGQEYTGERARDLSHARALLQIDSPDAAVMADAMERGLGLSKATAAVNTARVRRGLDPVGRSAVYSLHLRCKPVVTAIELCKQGKTDPYSHWAVARYAWVTQLLLRLGESDVRLPCLPVIDGVQTQGPVPLWYCRERLTAIDIRRVGWFDEVHMEPVIASGGVKAKGRAKQVRYRRDPVTGRPTGSDSGVLAPRKYRMKVKYSEQCRLMLGVALNASSTFKKPGVTLQPFDYTGKWVLSMSAFEAARDKCRSHVQGKGSVSRWVTGRRGKEVYMEDLVDFLPLQSKAADQLRAFGIKTVAQFRKLSRAVLDRVALLNPGNACECWHKFVPTVAHNLCGYMLMLASVGKVY